MNIEKVLVNKKIEITYQLFYVSRGYQRPIICINNDL